MTLEEFFTLTELKDGLTSPDRVKELITVMHRENGSNIKNLSEATRQRSIVATTVAATENKNCLDLFIHLNGLHFFDMWLKDAQKLGNDNGNGFSEESIIALLRALERLPIDNERSLCSGIGRTVQNLVAHRSLMIRNRAKTLCDKWVLIQDNGVAPRDVESPDVVIFNSHVNDNDEKNVERPGDETMPFVSVDNIQRVIVNNEEINGRIKTDLVEMSTLSSHLEQIASSAEYENALESSRKTDLRGDEDEDMVDDGESSDHLRTTKSLNTMNQGGVSAANALRDPPEAESLKTSSNSESGNSNTDSTNCKESPLVDGSDKAVTSESEKTLSGGSERPSAAEPLKDAEQRKSFKADITASQVSEIAQESEANTERGVLGFDLNQEVCSEEVDNPINRVSSTVSIVSASRAVAVAASGLPSAPLQFEGTRGWKGSALTSAFRQIPDSSRAHNNKQRSDCLDIDLNVAEDSDDKMLAISGLPSGEESSVEAGPRRPERMLLDLNSIGDEGGDTVGLDWGRDGRFAPVNPNGWQSPSRSSSSSSKQPSLRNIDLNLNDRPVFPLSNHKESVISFFGTKVEVKTKDSLPQPSGRILEPPVDFNLGRPGAGLGLESSINYGNPPFYGHNGFAPGAGAAMFFYGSPGGPIPYMVDSRGAPVVPQMMGSSQPPSPFIMNMAVAGSSSGSTEPGPLLHNFNLNTGLTIDGGNRETVGGLRQFFHHNGGSMDEQYLRANSSLQASSTCVVGGKRREPDAARWELFPVNKHPQPQPQPPWR